MLLSISSGRQQGEWRGSCLKSVSPLAGIWRCQTRTKSILIWQCHLRARAMTRSRHSQLEGVDFQNSSLMTDDERGALYQS